MFFNFTKGLKILKVVNDVAKNQEMRHFVDALKIIAGRLMQFDTNPEMTMSFVIRNNQIMMGKLPQNNCFY